MKRLLIPAVAALLLAGQPALAGGRIVIGGGYCAPRLPVVRPCVPTYIPSYAQWWVGPQFLSYSVGVAPAGVSSGFTTLTSVVAPETRPERAPLLDRPIVTQPIAFRWTR